MIGRRPSIVSALEALRPKAQWTLAGDSYTNLQWLDETQTKPTEEEVNAKIAEMQVIEDRKLAYGSIADQLDMQYWDSVNGTTTWKEHIAQVKSDNPKPS